MATIRLTDLYLRNLKPDCTKQIEVFDAITSGLSYRLSPGGTGSWYLNYRIGSRKRRYKLGTLKTMPLAEARKSAQAARALVEKGEDPQWRRVQEAAATTDLLFEAVAREFVEKHAKRKTRTWKETERILTREFFPTLGEIPIHRIRRRDIIAITEAIVARGSPIMANRAHAAIRKLFRWALRGPYHHVLSVSPCADMERPSKPAERDRVYSDAELVKVWRAAEAIGHPFGTIVHLLILTGARLNEIAQMRWQEIDFESASWTINTPGQNRTNKSGRQIKKPLTPMLLAIIMSIPRIHDEYVFPSTRGTRPVSGFSKWRKRLNQLSGIFDATNHDFRTTLSTRIADLDIEMGSAVTSAEAVEFLLNHRLWSGSKVKRKYNQSHYQKPVLKVLTIWGNHIITLLENDEASSTPVNPIA